MKSGGRRRKGKEVRKALLSFFIFYLETSAWGKEKEGKGGKGRATQSILRPSKKVDLSPQSILRPSKKVDLSPGTSLVVQWLRICLAMQGILL